MIWDAYGGITLDMPHAMSFLGWAEIWDDRRDDALSMDGHIGHVRPHAVACCLWNIPYSTPRNDAWGCKLLLG